jgi:hypothetical protein
MSKAASTVLILAIPVFLGYPADLNVGPREKRAPERVESVAVEIWPAVPTAVFSLQPRWLITKAQTARNRLLDGDFLAKELQRELRRVGCYGGEINGVWTESTRRGMQAFTNRVNARLPIERPDHILLALLQSHPDNACKKPCPLGEHSAVDGRCVPVATAGLPIKTASVSQAKTVPLVTGWTATETPAPGDFVSPDYKLYRPPLMARSPPASKIVAAPTSKQAPSQRPVLTAASRAQPPTLPDSRREKSRPIQQSQFVRALFQALDSSAR